MKGTKHITKWLAASLATAILLSLPALASINSLRPRARSYWQQSHAQQSAPPHQQGRPGPRGHAGDWLRHNKDLPPAEQERALQNDPHFRRLNPQQQQRILRNMETWEHLTPEQKHQARQVFGQMQQLPPDRRRMVSTAIRDLRTMPPQQREQIIDSERFRSMFSPQEREMLRGATRLPLAPAEPAP